MAIVANELLSQFSTRLGVPAALLRRVRGQWQFAGQEGDAPSAADLRNLGPFELGASLEQDGRFWTGIVVNDLKDWVLLVPGRKDVWEGRTDLELPLEQLAAGARAVSRQDRATIIARADRIAYTLGRRLAGWTDPARIYRHIVRAAARAVRADMATLALYVPGDASLKIVSTEGYPHAIVEHVRLEPGEAVIGKVFASGQLFYAGAESREELQLIRARYRTASCIALPLFAGERSIGVLSVADPAEGVSFTSDDVLALKRVAPVASLALAGLRTQGELEALALSARIDPVTRLANRQYLISRLEAELQRAHRLHQPLAMMLVDVDDFKRVNDNWGHLEGDHLLREIGALLMENVRLFDVCARYGGEEFAVIMPGAYEAVARQVSERVRRAVEDAFRGAVGGPKITLSAGVTLVQSGDTSERLIGRADQALLKAKAEGKNAVRFAAAQ